VTLRARDLERLVQSLAASPGLAGAFGLPEAKEGANGKA
jgi:hypothetical protein